MVDGFDPLNEPDLSRRKVSFDDNRLIISVFGQHDRNLARLEQQLDVTLINRGNLVIIEGSRSACELTNHVLSELYDMARRGHVIDSGDVDGVIRMAQGAIPKMTASRPAGGNQNFAATSVKGERQGGIKPPVIIKTRKKTILPRSPGQADYMQKLAEYQMVFGVGPAGTGKTYLAVSMAIAQMLEGSVERIILSRPAVEAGENLGFLPGDLKEKIDPYLRPLYDALDDMMPADQVQKRIECGQIEIAPLAYMRGRTLSNAFVILDEAQNTTPMQMKMFLTRFGENSRMAICGDPSQVDLPRGAGSGLVHALSLVRNIEEIGITRFQSSDVVRHPLVGRIVDAYEQDDNRPSTAMGNFGGSELRPFKSDISVSKPSKSSKSISLSEGDDKASGSLP